MGSRQDDVTVTGPTGPTGSDDADPTVETRDPGYAHIPGAPLARGTTVGRYVILDLVGRGGMGVVYKAADPELDRRVALKLVHIKASDDGVAAARLLREAQALAQLSHPNVVTVYDAGTFRDAVYIAMELIEGQTLRRWLKEEPRSRREVLDILASAGAGLAAAHRAGIIHRDFKPDNIIVGADQRVRVLDFGLARAAAERFGDSITTPGSESRLSSGDLSIAGSIRGTPAYMAPEQHAGAEIDARSDQFSFCVVLYEALHGGRPFTGGTVAELADNIKAGNLLWPISALEAPGWLRAVIARGLATRAEDRFPSMDALLAELTREHGRLRRRVIAGAALAALLGGAVVIGGLVDDDAPARSPCANVESELAGAWDRDTGLKVEQAFVATGRPYAAQTAERVDRVLDVYARDWKTARRDACEATLVRGSQSAELMDRRVTCLSRRRDKLAALTSTFATAPSEELLEDAIELAHALPALDACNDRDALMAAVPLPDSPEARSRIAALRRRVDDVEARTRNAGLEQARTDLDVALQEIRELDYPPLLAEALYVRAGAELTAGDPKAAEQTLHEAAQAAAGAKDDLLSARIWTRLINVVGDAQARHDDALALRHVADPALTRAGADPLLRAEFLDEVGNVLWAKGLYPAARPYHEQALAVRSAVLPADDPELASSLVHLGGLAWSVGELDEARALLERGLAIRERAFGPDHPDVSKLLSNLGSVAKSQGNLEAALAYHRRAMAIAEGAMGTDHTLVAICANNLADVERAMGKLPDARALLERATLIFTKALGESHPHVATSIQNLGEVALAERQPDAALAHFERALAAFETTLGADHPYVAYPLTGVGLAHLDAGRPAEAVAPLERALTIRESKGVQPAELAVTQFALARALRSTAGRAGAKRAAALGAAARAGFAGAGEGFAAELAAVDAWIAAGG